MTTMANWLREQFCNLVYFTDFLCNKSLLKKNETGFGLKLSNENYKMDHT
jgi:hypothetical protein